MANYKLIIAYNGASYIGWQRQPKGRTIQGTIEKALSRLFKEAIVIHGAGRTDKGVHAYGQVAHFNMTKDVPADNVKRALNHALEPSIQIIDCECVERDFHSRYCCQGKTYIYRLKTHTQKDPFLSECWMLYPKTLNEKAIRQAMPFFIGTHDFSAFTAAGSDKEDKVRTIYDFELAISNDEWVFNITGNGFLYNMVRIIIGTLIKVGEGQIQAQSIPQLLKEKSREKTRFTAPAEGLYLSKVYYKAIEYQKIQSDSKA